MPANKIKLEICGASYVIATTDTEEYILSLAEKLDADMNQMMTNNPSRLLPLPLLSRRWAIWTS